jgi:hypothetical protein
LGKIGTDPIFLFDYGADFPLLNDIRSSMPAAADDGIKPVRPLFTGDP